MSTPKRHSRELRERLVRFCVGIAISLTCLFVYGLEPHLLQLVDKKVYDRFLHSQRGGTPSPTPAFIDIDDESLAEFGQWPWPRHLMAKLVANLTEAGAAGIGLDILFAEPDNASVLSLKRSFKQHFNIDLPLDGIPQELHDNDLIFASILAQTPSILGVYARYDGETVPLPDDLPFQEGITKIVPPNAIQPLTYVLKSTGITLPLPELRAVAPFGTLNTTMDSDGIIRTIPLISQVGDRVTISLSLRTLMLALKEDNLRLISGPNGLLALACGKYIIPVTPQGHLMLKFRGPSGYYPTFSAGDILNNRIPAEELERRVFIVGASAAGLMDIRATPFDSMYPGPEVHVTALDTILSRNFLQIPDWEKGVQMSGVLLLGALSSALFALAPAIAYLPMLAALFGGVVFASLYMFKQGLYISPLYSIMSLVSVSLVLLGIRFWQESRQKRNLRSAFSRYIAPDMVARIVDMGEAVLTGEEREVTLLFTDIRGFTTLSEKLSPDQVVSALNKYFTPMTAIIRSSHGTMDKFIGDAVMAFWNAPLYVSRHPLRAINSAMEMHVALLEVNKDLEEEMGVSLRMGAGVHTGKVYVGNMGSAELLDYTCIGDNVNLAARLEGMCAIYGVGIITSAETANQCLTYASGEDGLPPVEIPFFLPLDSIRVKGKTLPVEICTPMTLAEKKIREEEIQSFMDARNAYVRGDFNTALEGFSELITDFPESILYNLYAERSQTLAKTPPQQWDGVWTFSKK